MTTNRIPAPTDGLNSLQAFAREFLAAYLQFGLGSMSKTDIDALVMTLIDRYGYDSTGPLAHLGNQEVSERVRAPVAKVKKMRYDGALKFGGSVADQAKARILAALSNATLDTEEGKVCLIIEDALAKNWLQGELKKHRQIFDHSFNTEIIKVNAEGLFKVLEQLFSPVVLAEFRDEYDKVKSHQNKAERAELFRTLAVEFAKGAAEASSNAVVTLFKAYLGLA